MKHRLSRIHVSAALALTFAIGAAVGCTESTPTPIPPPSDTDEDASTEPDASDDGASPPGEDGGADANTGDASPEDASSDPDADAATDTDADAAAPTGCAAEVGADFCDDFDDEDAFTAGVTKWDFVETGNPAPVSTSLERSVSQPRSALTQIFDGSTPGAKFAKTTTKAGFTEATWDYDIFLENIGNGGGFFLDDFQFTDDGGPDRFGFRLVILSDAGAIGTFRVEHNGDAAGTPYVIEPNLSDGTIELGKWHHLQQTVKFSFADADGGTDGVEYALYVDHQKAPAFTQTYSGIPREKAAFARFASLAYVFDKGASAGLKIHWDNSAVRIR